MMVTVCSVSDQKLIIFVVCVVYGIWYTVCVHKLKWKTYNVLDNQKHMQFFIAGFVYTAIWNFVDFPAGVVRFGTETGAEIDSYDDQDEPMLKSAKHVSREILFTRK